MSSCYCFPSTTGMPPGAKYLRRINNACSEHTIRVLVQRLHPANHDKNGQIWTPQERRAPSLSGTLMELDLTGIAFLRYDDILELRILLAMFNDWGTVLQVGCSISEHGGGGSPCPSGQ